MSKKGKWEDDVMTSLPGVDDETPAGVGRGLNRFRKCVTEIAKARRKRQQKQKEQQNGDS